MADLNYFYYAYGAAALSLFFLNQADTTTMIFLALLLFSGSEIGSGMNWSLVGDFFGREHYATIRGSMAPIYNIALFTMPIFAGWIKDTTDSYEIVLISGSIMLIISAIIFSLLKKPIKKIMVGATGFEPVTSAPPVQRATELRHAPLF